MFESIQSKMNELEYQFKIIKKITEKVQEMAANPSKVTITRKELEHIYSEVIEYQKEFESEMENLSKELDRLKQMDQPN